MKPLSLTGAVLLLLGLVSLFVSIPRRETDGFSIGGVTVGVETRHSEKAPPVVSAVLILAGTGLLVAARRPA